MATNSVLAKMAVQISANSAEFNRKLGETQKGLQSFTTGITRIAGAIGVAFGAQQIASFALEVAKLAGEAQGVRTAFERLPESTRLMEELKQATGGTVSELDLMKRAVQASNFDISLQALPRLLEFATLRAQQTGQSVDYLVDSIVTGIGRKSKLILDNLGISAVQLTEALGGASAASSSIGEVADAVGRIAEENLKNMAGFSDNASTKLQNLAASWENVKVAIGETANETGVLGGAIDSVTEKFNILSSRNLSFFEKLGGLISLEGQAGVQALALARSLEKQNTERKKQEQIIREVDRAFKEFNGDIDAYGKVITQHIYQTELLAEFTKRLIGEDEDRITTVGELREVEKELLATRESLNAEDTKGLTTNAAQIQAIRERIKAIDDLLKVQEKSKTSIQTDRASTTTTVSGVGQKTGSDLITESGVDLTISKLQQLEKVNSNVTANIETQWLDLSGAVSSALSTVADGLGQAIAGVGDFGDTIVKALAGFARQIGETLIGIGTGMLVAQTAIKNPYTAIAAGVALVALSGALVAGLSSAQQNFNAGGGGFSPGSNGGSRSVGGSSGFLGLNPVEQVQLGGTIEVAGDKLLILLRNAESKERGRRG